MHNCLAIGFDQLLNHEIGSIHVQLTMCVFSINNLSSPSANNLSNYPVKEVVFDMIKLATMSSVSPDWTVAETVSAMKRYGYTGFEPRVEWGHACQIETDLSTEQRSEVRDQFLGEGLEICCIATGVRMATPNVAERDGHIEDLRRYIDLAADVGCRLVRTFGGQRDPDVEWPAVIDYVAEGYLRVVDQASDAGVIMLLETHDDWCSTAPVRSVIETVDHLSLQVLWDFMHPQRMMETPEESFLAVGMLTRHTHVHDGCFVDGKLRVLDRLGDGEIDHAGPLGLLRLGEYDGYASLEVIHSSGSDYDADAVLRQHAEALRNLIE